MELTTKPENKGFPAETIRDDIIKCADLLILTEDLIRKKDVKGAEDAFIKSSESFNEAFATFQDYYTELLQSEEYEKIISVCDEISGNLQKINKTGRALGLNMLSAVKPIESEIEAIRASPYIAQKDYSSAMKIYDASIKKNKHSATVWIARSMCLTELEKYKEAIRSADKGIAAEEDSQRGWFCKGVAYLRSGRYERALEAFEEAVIISTSEKSPYHYMLLTYLGLNLRDEAESLIKQLLKKNPGPEDYYIIYLVQNAFKNEAEAEDAKRHALETEPDIETWESTAGIKSEVGRIISHKKK